MKNFKVISTIFLVLNLSLAAWAEDEFSAGSPEYDADTTSHYSEAEIQKKIEDEMAVSCKGNLCSIVSSDGTGDGWSVSMQVGYGTNQNNGGNNFYIGGNGFNNNQANYYTGITVTYKNQKCTSQLNVTPAVYRFVQTYLYDMVNTDGTTKRNFSPADQTVVLFYTTILNKVDNCKSSL
jgi:hypothetical protein